MSSNWNAIPLGQFLRRVERFELRDDLKEYQFAGTYSFARGIFLADRKLGASFKLPKVQRVKAGDFVYCKIMAWEGAFGTVPQYANDCVMSGAFVAYELDKTIVDARFLDWYFRSPSNWQQIGRQSTGTNVRRQSLHPDQFEGAKIRLPLLEEQRHIVARIEDLASKVEEAVEINKGSLEASRRLLSAMAHRSDLTVEAKLSLGWQRARLRDVLKEYSDPVAVQSDAIYPNFGIYSFGRGLFSKPPISGFETSASRLFRARTGLFIYSRLFAFEGAYGLIGSEHDGYFVSNEYPMFECKEDRMLPEFLASYLLPSNIWRDVAEGSGGLGDRRQRVQPDHFLKHELLLPPLDWQQKIKSVRAYFEESAPLNAEVAAELKAILPAILDKAFKGELC